MSLLGLAAAAVCVMALAVHVVTACLALVRCRPKRSPGHAVPLAQRVSIVRPVSGLEEYDKETLESTFLLDFANYEVIICSGSDSDPAVAFVRTLIAKYPTVPARILVGRTLVTANPKLDNIDKGYRAAQSPWIIFADCNVLLPRDYVQTMLAAWTPDTGLVCAPPIGTSPLSFWAEVECAFLNSYQARWQYAADGIGYGFAQGKSMLWQRETLERFGGVAALATEIAEDAAATKLVRQAGLHVRLARPPFHQPLGKRTLHQFWQRQTRWAQLRRQSFPLHFIPEVLTTSGLPLAAGATACADLGQPAVPALVAILFVWWGAEACLARACGWPLSWRSPAAWVARDLLIPVIWCIAWVTDRYVWRGSVVTLKRNSGEPLPLEGR
jgi:ceramide glucosyltransferase